MMHPPPWVVWCRVCLTFKQNFDSAFTSLQANYPVCSLKQYLINKVFFQWTAYSLVANCFILHWQEGCNNCHNNILKQCWMTWKPQYSQTCLKSPSFPADMKCLLGDKMCQYKWSSHKICCQVSTCQSHLYCTVFLHNTTYSTVNGKLHETDFTVATSMYIIVAKSTSTVTQQNKSPWRY